MEPYRKIDWRLIVWQRNTETGELTADCCSTPILLAGLRFRSLNKKFFTKFKILEFSNGEHMDLIWTKLTFPLDVWRLQPAHQFGAI